MKIQFLIDIRGPVDGKDIGRFKAGDVADLPQPLARKLMGSQIAAEYVEPAPVVADAPAAEPARDAGGYPVTE